MQTTEEVIGSKEAQATSLEIEIYIMYYNFECIQGLKQAEIYTIDSNPG